MSRLFLPLLILSMATASLAQEFVVNQMYVDQTVQPQSIVDALGNCVRSDACTGAALAAAAYFGVSVDPQIVVVARVAASRQGDPDGETFDHILPIPEGYRFCRLQFNPVSIAPGGGARASEVEIWANPTFAHLYTWTPRQGLGGGRSWVEAEVTVLGVRNDLYGTRVGDGTCRSIEQRTLIGQCKGNPCNPLNF